jgi:hypothetical protein
MHESFVSEQFSNNWRNECDAHGSIIPEGHLKSYRGNGSAYRCENEKRAGKRNAFIKRDSMSKVSVRL